MKFASYSPARKSTWSPQRYLWACAALAVAPLTAPSVGCSSGDDAAAGGGSGGSSVNLGQAGQPDFKAPAQCTSQTRWTQGDHGSELMHPGAACLNCHSTNEGPELAVAGTVFPSAHEPDDCNGAGTIGAVVVIEDADGIQHRLQVNSAGNFKLEGKIAFPYHAQVQSHGLLRAMVSPQSSGDCNGCHTQSGENGAPGRIVAP